MFRNPSIHNKKKKKKFKVYGTVYQRKPSPQITSLSKAHYKAQVLFVIAIFGGLKLILRVIFSCFTFLPKKDKDKNKKLTPTQSASQTRHLLATSLVRAQHHSANNSGSCNMYRLYLHTFPSTYLLKTSKRYYSNFSTKHPLIV